MADRSRAQAARHTAPFGLTGVVAALLLVACGSSAASSQAPAAAERTQIAPSATTVTSAPSATTVTDPSAPIPARGAVLAGPTGLVFDGAGNLYVSGCAASSFIYRIDPKGMLTTIAGTGVPGYAGDGGPATAAQLFCAVGMAFRPDGALYFADHGNNRIRRIDTSGVISTVAGSGPTGVDQGSFSGDGGQATKATLQEPWGVAFDRAGNLFIGDRDNYRVRRVAPNGLITTVAGNGDLKFSGDGGPATAAAMCPYGVVVDGGGHLLIGDACNDRVRSVDGHGVISTVAGTGMNGSTGDGGPATNGTLQGPGFLALDGRGRIFVQELLRVRRIDRTGVITTIAGIGKAGVPTDGMPALHAPLPELYGLAVDAAGNVYVADSLTTVYRIDPNGVLTVFAGKPS